MSATSVTLNEYVVRVVMYTKVAPDVKKNKIEIKTNMKEMFQLTWNKQKCVL